MSENTTCPYSPDDCPNILKSQSKIDLLSQKIDLSQKHNDEKFSEILSSLNDIKTFLNEGLEKKIDERVEAALNKYQAKILRWIVMTLLGSGGLSAIIAFLVK